jgi:ABC-type transporter Mla subunit MlaD
MSDPPEDRIVPIRSLQGARLDERFDATLADLEVRRDELVRVISRLTEGLSMIDQAGADSSAQWARDLIGLLATAKAQLDEISAIIAKLRPS